MRGGGLGTRHLAWRTIGTGYKSTSRSESTTARVATPPSRPARPLEDQEVLTIGRHRLRFLQTPHVPHCWDAGLLFDETTRTLLCSDLLHQSGDVAPVTESQADVLERHRSTLVGYQAGPLADYLPYTRDTERILHALAALEPTTLATMHGATYRGDGGAVLRALGGVLKELFGPR